MDTPIDGKPVVDLRDFLAEERTVLAWIRTGIALMGLGFVVARFGLFLEEIQINQGGSPAQQHRLSLWFGTALIVAGVAVNLFSAWRVDAPAWGREPWSIRRPSLLRAGCDSGFVPGVGWHCNGYLSDRSLLLTAPGGSNRHRGLIGFNTGVYDTIALSEWMAGNPPDATKFSKPFAKFPRKDVFIADKDGHQQPEPQRN